MTDPKPNADELLQAVIRLTERPGQYVRMPRLIDEASRRGTKYTVFDVVRLTGDLIERGLITPYVYEGRLSVGLSAAYRYEGLIVLSPDGHRVAVVDYDGIPLQDPGHLAENLRPGIKIEVIPW
jgi:hypothetical protein